MLGSRPAMHFCSRSRQDSQAFSSACRARFFSSAPRAGSRTRPSVIAPPIRACNAVPRVYGLPRAAASRLLAGLLGDGSVSRTDGTLLDPEAPGKIIGQLFAVHNAAPEPDETVRSHQNHPFGMAPAARKGV